MASKRKSTTPCMVLPTEAGEQDPDMEMITELEEGTDAPVETPSESAAVPAENASSEEDMQDVDRYIETMDSKKVEGGYECKYCSFQTTELNMFTFHVDSEHPNVVLNSSYVCVECNFLTKRYDALSEHNLRYHPGEDNFTRTMVKRNNQTIFEQTVNDLTFDGSFVQQENEEGGEDTTATGIPLSKTPIMKMKNKAEPKRIAVPHKAAEENEVKDESEGEQEPKETAPVGTPAPVEVVAPVPMEPVKPSVVVSNSSAQQDPKKTIINSATVLPAGLAQVLSALQAQQNSQTQLLIPVSSIPTYNGAMDNNALLVSTYNKFPYPSVSEIMGLSAQTKYTEEQIKIWFSAQRLKHGVSWTPEEVEEARRKQFNGTVHTVPQTITVIPAHLSAAANGLQPILQTCQIVGQPGLVLTQVGGTNPLPVTTPITLAVAGVPNQTHLPKPAMQTTPTVVETKRATTVQPPPLTPQENSALSADNFGMRPKKSKEQLAELKASYLKNHFASDAEIARLMKLTNLTKGEIKKWFSDTRYNQRNSKNNHVIVFNENNNVNNNATIVIDSSDETTESPTSGPVKESRKQTWNPFPDFTLQKFKEKTPEQLLILEESYQKNSTPTDEELSRLRSETKLTRREIDAWFTEKRKAPESTDSKPERKESDPVKSVAVKQASQTPPSGRSRSGREKIGKKTPEQLHVLKSAFVRTQWPSSEEYDKLAEESRLPRSYIVNWFGDTRYAWKNGNLKWYFYYQSGNISAINGSGYRKRGRGRARNRGRGRPRGRPRAGKRSSSWGRSPPVMKFKTGKEILKEYYLKHKFLNEQDLDELVAKSNMGYEQVRDWFAEVHRREDTGADPFDDGVENEEPEEEESQGESEAGAGGLEDVAGDEEDDETDDSETWEPPRSVRRTLSGSED
ncbi:zinc fingers and homeoboxes protein 1 isoform X1 [Lepisosteus oculatus]|uniref:zinc fingers and homeoboxes protein 1 isoform X1 n=1 Tax=Lepisosteus oculatus TaxID=7918 RepID=UPI0003EAA4F3|nr:PREDICTED: zinc fingers and homeoboxes protein 1 isoform X1 [Lepisosteus oculatus]XP_015213381.1 PREDICTED: zinc fingers and homeoboxes protein 1 isoform X1 [Lepisosteus oculatus]XP_015213382.1 PREDICTED: zinc fingers and homeoboxes protein 1 isoform X1 [Lepisosteus oculatus]XP_015213383.1 PREDICTED: zinc fingers and homeoboxes protein 1 isoform X1 [Lepisosteus oculatus]